VFASCNTGVFVEPRTLAASEIEGTYRSSDQAGVLGILELGLVRLESSRVYTAVLSGKNPEEFGTSEGIGTLADDHLVLNFDRGLNSDFYFEAKVTLNDAGDPVITGEFIFPDQKEQLPVEFLLQTN
jgi:hypothetical protein